MSIPKPEAIQPRSRTRCSTCLHPWVAQWIEDAFQATFDANLSRPSAPVLYQAITAYWEKHHVEHKLAAPPNEGQVTGHTVQRHHPKNWTLWD